MNARSLAALSVATLLGVGGVADAALTDAQKCESSIELASGKYAQCLLKAESRDTKKPDPVKREAALAKCSQKLSDAFAKATDRYGVDCAATEPSSAFDAYLAQCSDDATAAAGGAALPDYAGELASCNADLDACEAEPTVVFPGDGQDGTALDFGLEHGPALSYTNNCEVDGTFIDDNTGLMWECKTSPGPSIHYIDNVYTWTDSVDNETDPDGTLFTVFLDTLNNRCDGDEATPCTSDADCTSIGNELCGHAGHRDWRVPTVKELVSIIDYSGIYPAKPYSVPSIYQGFLWSATTFGQDLKSAWGVGFQIAPGPSFRSKNVPSHVSAVRGAP